MQRAGVGILAGSDAGANEYSVPGFSLHDELAALVARRTYADGSVANRHAQCGQIPRHD